MDEFQRLITNISLMLQKKDPDLIWYFEKGRDKEKERYELEGVMHIHAKEGNLWQIYCCSMEEDTIKLERLIGGKQQNNKGDSLSVLESDIAKDWILKKIQVIMDMVAFSISNGRNETLMEWDILPDKKICKKVAMILPRMLKEEGFIPKVFAECIDNGDGIIVSW